MKWGMGAAVGLIMAGGFYFHAQDSARVTEPGLERSPLTTEPLVATPPTLKTEDRERMIQIEQFRTANPAQFKAELIKFQWEKCRARQEIRPCYEIGAVAAHDGDSATLEAALSAAKKNIDYWAAHADHLPPEISGNTHGVPNEYNIAQLRQADEQMARALKASLHR